ncbi:hypothetical protein [Clostridium sp.]|uniref:hypothetical protein n=1 Tax=Clostridium sp. TaxID=1506 RepID=UPI002A90F89B|nr:hypothetical protein [Clostridium sp.]MDY6012747.1 hypothetical protein [Clostridium sp.]
MKILKDKKKKIIIGLMAVVAVIALGLIYINISNNIKREKNEKIIEEDKKLLEDIKQNNIVKPTYSNEHEHDDEIHNHE